MALNLDQDDRAWELWDAVMPLLRPLLDPKDAKSATEDAEDGGYPLLGLDWAFASMEVPIPEQVVRLVREAIPELNAADVEEYGMERALNQAIERVGIAKGQ